ncbi:MAG: hypothetical protein AAFY20_00875 [Cyanobacteria bacterium J06639_14]
MSRVCWNGYHWRGGVDVRAADGLEVDGSGGSGSGWVGGWKGDRFVSWNFQP